MLVIVSHSGSAYPITQLKAILYNQFGTLVHKIEEYGLEELKTILGPLARYSSGKISNIPSSPEKYFKSV